MVNLTHLVKPPHKCPRYPWRQIKVGDFFDVPINPGHVSTHLCKMQYLARSHDPWRSYTFSPNGNTLRITRVA